MAITTEDCKKVLCEIYETKPNNWKRVKKYKIDDVWYRDFENSTDNYTATLKEQNGQLYLVPKELFKKIEGQRKISESSIVTDDKSIKNNNKNSNDLFKSFPKNVKLFINNIRQVKKV